MMYQIYPRSFQDSNGDGIGDLRGIINRIDHLSTLGIDLLWLGPIYESPNDDNGYDISDYRRIHPEFGTMEDFEELLSRLHQKGIRLIMDLVVNHTSDEHQWFRDARRSKDSPYRDYYYWTHQPNNYVSYFGGSAWEQTSETGASYLHLFSKKQPDLNWENPKVRFEVYDIMKFWLDKGIDGFRMDVISLISKRLPFKQSSSTEMKFLIEEHYANGPRIHEYIQEMNEEVLRHYDIMTVGEGPGITKSHAVDYVGYERNELSMIFHLDLMFMDFGARGKFDYQAFPISGVKKCWMEWDEAMKDLGWNNIFLDNHDFPRMLSRFGNDRHYHFQAATLLATLLLTFRGTPCIYQGSEMGMTNVQFDSLDDYDDIELQNFRREHVGPGKMPEDEFLKIAHIQARDNARTPVQWSSQENAGFTKGKPWIKVNPNYKEVNLDKCQNIFEFYRDLIQFRKKHPDLVYADLHNLDTEHDTIFYYSRGKYSILLNMSDEVVETYALGLERASVLISNYNIDTVIGPNRSIRPWEALIFEKTD